MGRKNIFEFCYMMMAAAGQNKITLEQWRIKQHSRLISVWTER
jgi:ribosomal protein S10